MAKGYDRPEDDFYPSNKYLVDGLFEFVDLNKLASTGYNFFEPCKGDGAIYNYLPEKKDYCSLEEGRDYFEYTSPYDPKKIIVTNPPFKHAQKFLEKSLSEAKVVIYFLRLNFLGSGARYEFFRSNPPDHFIVSSDRPSFTRDGNTDSCDYAWFVYDRENILGLTQASYFFEDPVRAERRENRKKKELNKKTNLKD